MITLDLELEAPPARARCLRETQDEPRHREALREPPAESAAVCLITVDQDGIIIDCDSATERAFACDRSRVVGLSMAGLVIPPAIRDRQWRGVFRHLLDGAWSVPGPWFEVIATRANGSEFPAEMAISRIRTDEPPCYAVGLRDTSERKRMELNTELLVRAA
jgi:PAS domain S-box-containing protein